MRTNLILASTFCAALGGCFTTDIENGVLLCADDPTRPCPQGFVCIDGACWREGTGPGQGDMSVWTGDGGKPPGLPCLNASECASGFCVDGFCCDSDCIGQCQACDVPTARGQCTTVTSGQPHGSRTQCVGAGTTCGGTCVGDPFVCTFPDASTTCRDQSCASAVLTLADGCDGAGACKPERTMNCPAPLAKGTAACSQTMCGFQCDPYYGPSGNTCVPVWTPENSGVADDLFAIWGSGANNIYVVGRKKILHSTGNGTWTLQKTATTGFADFKAVWGDKSNAQYVWAVGGIGAVWHTNNSGASWTQETIPSINTVYEAIGGGGFTQLYALGARVTARDSTNWTDVTQTVTTGFRCVYHVGFGAAMYAGATNGRIYSSSSTSAVFSEKYNPGWPAVTGISGAFGDVWAVGPGGRVLHADTSSDVWGSPAQTSNTGADLNAVYVTFDASGKHPWAVGSGGTIIRHTTNGVWQPYSSGTTVALNGVWGASPDDVYAVGGGGTILHYRK